MSLKLTAASFLNGVRQSGLVELDRLDALLRELQQTGVDTSDSRSLAEAFVRRDALTSWQAEKLLQGRHKGFILGRYRLLSLLGAGEMSAVFLAKHIMMDRQCAIKVLPGNKVHDTSYLGRFYREARAVASLNHPNIVRAFDVDKQLDGGAELHYLVMEYVEGKNLEKLIATQGRLPVSDVVDYIRQAAAGLGHAHQAGLVHRDVKPQNLLVDAQGQLKLLDLGLARFFKGESNEESLTIKHDEKVLGTADFLAPEQAVDSHNVDARADIYSLGCTMYFALAGHPPFTEGTLVQRLLAHQTRLPTPIVVVRPDTPPAVAAIVEKMMAKKAADRYQSMAEVCDALARWLVDYAGEDWKRVHMQLVAMYAPLEAPLPTPKPSVAVVAPVALPVVKSAPMVTPVASPAAAPVPAKSLEEQIASEIANLSEGVAESRHVSESRKFLEDDATPVDPTPRPIERPRPTPVTAGKVRVSSVSATVPATEKGQPRPVAKSNTTSRSGSKSARPQEARKPVVAPVPTPVVASETKKSASVRRFTRTGLTLSVLAITTAVMSGVAWYFLR